MTPQDKKYVRIWYWSGAALVFVILIIGGITRLTGSGLSITDWKPIMGIVPPVTESQWEAVFDQYKQFPEYQQVNRGMTLSEFKFIYFWEYLHRMAGRLLGIVFIVPFAWFLIKKKIDKKNIRRAFFLLLLGFGQAFLGWYMVMSGLVDVPRVSPYRLAAHLSLAFIIFGFCVWFALDLKEKHMKPVRSFPEMYVWGILFFVILSAQIVWGALVAGHHAGHIYNTFPTMFGYWFPPELWLMEPILLNLIDNMVTVQWIHRVAGTLLILIGLGIWVRSYMLKTSFNVKKWALALLALLLTQYAIGVFTLVYHVPVWLGVLHQAFAMILFGVALGFLHFLRKGVGSFEF